MNHGLIVGFVRAEESQNPINGATVSLNHVQGSSERGGRIQLYTEQGVPSQNPNVQTDENGYFALWFFWDATSLQEAMTANLIPYQLNVIRPMTESWGIRYPVTRHQGALVRAVSLRAVADGRIPDLRDPTSVGGTIARTAVRIMRALRTGSGGRVPNMFLSPGRPSAEFYALLGAAHILARSFQF